MPQISINSEWGPDDPEVESLWMLQKNIIRKIEDPQVQDEADFRADRIYEKLVEARNHYIVLRDPEFINKTSSQRAATYNSYYSALWSAYKDRLAKQMNVIGYDIGCFFSSDEQFNSQIDGFVRRYPELESIKPVIASQRESWQRILHINRNANEHDGDFRNYTELPEINNIVDAKKMFIYVTWAIEGLSVAMLSYKIPEQWNIVKVNNNANVFDRVHRYELRHAMQGLDPEPLFDNPYQ